MIPVSSTKEMTSNPKGPSDLNKKRASDSSAKKKKRHIYEVL